MHLFVFYVRRFVCMSLCVPGSVFVDELCLFVVACVCLYLFVCVMMVCGCVSMCVCV